MDRFECGEYEQKVKLADCRVVGKKSLALQVVRMRIDSVF